MNKNILITTALVLIHLSLFAQDKINYAAQWSEVHKYELKDLPKSALELVDQIYAQAKQDQDYVQIVKSMIFQAKFAAGLKENHEIYIVNHFKEEIQHCEAPLRNILEGTLAQIYWQYYKDHRWEFYQRTQTESKVGEEDFRTWDLITLFEEIHYHFQQSLLHAEILKEINLEEINELLELNRGSKEYRPSLFDFLAHNALAFYRTTESRLTEATNKYEIRDEQFFDYSFRPDNLIPEDSLSLDYHALLIYQELLDYHEGKDTTAFIMVELERLEFVKNQGIFSEQDQLYLNALQKLRFVFGNHPGSTFIDCELADWWYNQGSSYDPGNNRELQFAKKTALEICETSINNFPQSVGAEKCWLLKNTILHPSLSITAEGFIPRNTHARLLVGYANIEQLHFSVFKVSENQEHQFEEMKEDSSRLAFLNTFKKEQSWDCSLTNLHDYQIHNTETILPPLTGGNYLVVARVPELEKVYGYAFIQVTDLVLVEKKMKEVNRFQVLNRNNGAAVKGALIQLKSGGTYSYSKYYERSFVTDENGFALVPKSGEHYGNLNAFVTTTSDSARFGNNYLSILQVEKEGKIIDEPIYVKPFVFADRSIYRPGQTVFFKGILTKKQGVKISVVSGEFVEVFLYDPNDEEVSNLRIKTNEFGSFSGEFKLPTTGLTGEYNISAEEDYEEDSKFYGEEIEDFEWNELYFSVEEYKRPTFEIVFNSMKDVVRLKDSVSITGNAIAFTGAPISGAKVTYKVTRQVRYPGWYFWSRPGSHHSSEAREISYGAGITNPDGTFDIRFLASPDEQVNIDNLPVFEFRIAADITDINGETRSAETTVKVGYHTMEISVNAPSVMNWDRRNQLLTIEAQNLNGQKVNTRGSLKVFQHKSPNRVLRDRPWPAPDIQTIQEDDFIKLFPHDPYTSENGSKQLVKGNLVYSAEFNTALNDTLQLPVNNQWNDGDYIIEIESKDDYDQLVLGKTKFKVKSEHSSEVSANQLVLHDTDKSDYAVGDKVKFTIGSASKDVTVTIDIEKDHKVVETQLFHLSSGTRTLSIPIKKSDIGGFVIHYHLVNYNAFKTGTQIINVTEPTEELYIETSTFRDKLQPGAKETWNFTIKGSKKSRSEIELLASMYDASLDQFKSHNWNINLSRNTNYYSNNQSGAYNSFKDENFRITNLPYPTSYIEQQQFDQQDWFGFSLSNNKYVNQRYLSRLSVIYYDTIRQESKIIISNDDKRKEGFVYGQIVDSEGELLPGVNVLVKGTNRGTITDINGEYSIQVISGAELVFSSVGYVNASVLVDKSNIIDVQLSEDVTRLSEIVVVGYGVQEKVNLSGSIITVADEETVIDEIVFEEAPEMLLAGKAPGVSVTNSEGESYRLMIRGISSLDENSSPLYVVDGVILDASQISADDLAAVSVLRGANAIAIYGSRAANGVILITTKSGQKKLDEELAKIQARKNLHETAFFFPHLTTDRKGNISFSFDTPEALTRWKLQLLAHTKSMATASKTLQAVTSKDLMVTPNAPRFLRQGDEVVISTRITNLTNESMEGVVGLQLNDPFKEVDLNTEFNHQIRNKSFSAKPRGNEEVSWRIVVPDSFDVVQYKIVAKAGDFSDGEQNVLPVLSNRMMVTETLPMQVKTGESKTFTLEKLKNNNSPTLKHHLLTLEVTSNPTWYALQALPYLMEFPYECAEQTFAKYYANVIGIHIVNQNEDVKKVFKHWATNDELVSNLESNEELKSIMIQETPWLQDAQNETAQKKRISKFFDEQLMNESLESSIYKLEQMQLGNGGFPWFSGSKEPDRYITQHIITGLAHLRHLGVDFESLKADYILNNGLKFLDNEIVGDYNNLLKTAETQYSTEVSKKEYLKKNHLSPIHIHYLYLHSYFHDSIISEKTRPAYEFFKKQSSDYWKGFNEYMKGMIALAHHRSGNLEIAKDIINSLKENSITSEEVGTYWKKYEDSWQWYYAPIETQSLLIEAISEIESNDTTLSEKEKIEAIDNLKIWLLKNKQTNRWPTTKSTTEAIFALLLKGSNWLSVKEQVDINIGDQKIEPQNLPEVATGYFKTSWSSDEIEPAMSAVKMNKKEEGIAWGGLYWQYFEDLDKITTAETSLSLSKSVFVVTNSAKGELLNAVNDTTKLQVGNLVRIRIELKADRSMDYLHMKDMRASGLEPVSVLSEYKWQDGLGYYESTRDASTNFFFDHLPKGVYVFEYDLRVNNSGHFSNGITTIQSMYAPEYSSHSNGIEMVVE